MGCCIYKEKKSHRSNFIIQKWLTLKLFKGFNFPVCYSGLSEKMAIKWKQILVKYILDMVFLSDNN